MAELRVDPVTGIPVILAPERAGRPDEYVHRGLGERREDVDCPFCPGREARTPGEVFALRDGNRWRVRAFPNLYPARVAGGAHEVMVETPRHVASFADLSESEAADAFEVYAERMRAWGGQGYPVVFKNVGEAAGASIEHTHAQILVLPEPPPLVRREAEGGCPLCEDLRREAAQGTRLVSRSERVVVYCPYGSRFPWEMRLAPVRHELRFEASELRGEAAGVLREALRRLEGAAGRPAYNFVIHTAHHWHVEVYPRTTGVGGFEWGTGVHINTLAPEEAARRLREQGERA